MLFLVHPVADTWVELYALSHRTFRGIKIRKIVDSTMGKCDNYTDVKRKQLKTIEDNRKRWKTIEKWKDGKMENGNNGIECDYFFFHGKENNWKQ